MVAADVIFCKVYSNNISLNSDTQIARMSWFLLYLNHFIALPYIFIITDLMGNYDSPFMNNVVFPLEKKTEPHVRQRMLCCVFAWFRSGSTWGLEHLGEEVLHR